MKHPPSLSSARDFRRVMASTTTRRASWGVIHIAPGEPDAPSRLGLAVPARSGGAVQRNRIKRRLRAAFRGRSPHTGLNVVVRARPEAATVDFQELERDLEGLAT